MSDTNGAAAPPSDAGGAPQDVGSSDSSFTLNDDTMYADYDEVETPPDSPTPGSEGTGAPGTQTVPQTAQPGAPAPGAAAQPSQQPTQQQTAPQGQSTQQPAQPTEGSQTPTPAGGGAPRIYTPGELASQLGQNRETMIDALASQKFQLSPKEIEQLEVDAVGVLPKIMARVYFDATVNGLQQMANMVPRMVEHVVQTRLTETQAESDFHSEWPNIDRNNAQHMNVVAQLANSFRQMNPGASKADAIRYVGQAATSFLGLQMPQRGNGAGRPAAAAPARRTSPPFAPAAATGMRPMPGQETARPQNPFDGMGMNFDE